MKKKQTISTNFGHSPYLQRKVRIVALPEGNHEKWVREAWIGLELPIFSDEPFTVDTVDVRKKWPTSRIGWLFQKWFSKTKVTTGYYVNACVAIDLLRPKDENAATWWESNAPHLLEKDRFLIFEQEVCELVDIEIPAVAND